MWTGKQKRVALTWLMVDANILQIKCVPLETVALLDTSAPLAPDANSGRLPSASLWEVTAVFFQVSTSQLNH